MPNYRIAADRIFDDWRIWCICKRTGANESRVYRIADVVWSTCREQDATRNTQELREICLERLRMQADYKETVSFIPAWLLGILIQVIVKILIDIFLEER
jgi:hypothetical protein